MAFSKRFKKKGQYLKKKSLQTLKKKAWKLYSEYVRRKAADYKETAQCVSCGTVIPWRSGDAGHFVSKSTGLCYYFHEKNVHFQCKPCNFNMKIDKGFTKLRYQEWMIKEYGPEIIDELESLKKIPCKYYTSDYEIMIETFKLKLENL